MRQFKDWEFIIFTVRNAIIAAVAIVLITAVLWGLFRGLHRLAMPGISEKEASIAIAICGVTIVLLVLLLPIHRYVTKTQDARREALRNYYTPENIAEYLQQFFYAREAVRKLLLSWTRGAEIKDADLAKRLRDQFDIILNDYFGKSRFYAAGALLIIVAAPVLFFTIEGGVAIAKGASTSDRHLGILSMYVDPISIAAVFGAYTWIATDAIERNYQGTLTPSSLYWYAVRIAVAIPLGQSIAVFALKDVGAGVAFLVSMFSYDRISAVTSGLVNRALSIPAAAADEKSDILVKLPDIDSTTAQLLNAEGITTILGLASSDPVRISVRTGLPFDQVVCLVDSALLWRYVGPDLNILREFGWAGASNVIVYKNAMDAMPQKEAVERELADKKAEIESADRRLEEIKNELTSATSDQRKTLERERKALGELKDRALVLETKQRGIKKLEDLCAAMGSANAGDVDVALLKDIVNSVTPAKRPTVCGLLNVIDEVSRDHYAQFIAQLMTSEFV